MARVGSVSTQPSSTRGTNSAQARAVIVASGRMRLISFSYAPDLIVPAVPITPTRLVFVADAAARAPGCITPTIGRSNSLRSAGSAWAVAVLQAITSALTRSPFRYEVISLL